MSRAECCRQGHEYSPDNTYLREGGARYCRICHNERNLVFFRAHHPPPMVRAPRADERLAEQLRVILLRWDRRLASDKRELAK